MVDKLLDRIDGEARLVWESSRRTEVRWIPRVRTAEQCSTASPTNLMRREDGVLRLCSGLDKSTPRSSCWEAKWGGGTQKSIREAKAAKREVVSPTPFFPLRTGGKGEDSVRTLILHGIENVEAVLCGAAAPCNFALTISFFLFT